MKLSDITQILTIENCSFPSPWSYRAFLSELKNKFAVYFVAVLNHQVVGYAGMWLFSGEAHVTTVAVDPGFRGRGLGRLLMNTLMEYARVQGAETMVLEVRPSNLAALNLYKSLGFRQIGWRKNYYIETGEDALVMLRNLQQETFLKQRNEEQ
ncbi:MAG: ribosomal protein S18-alanine N-acetyltransferase [Bacillota bacterium]|nr:ribosomal protein S18-alanine N-acetyltransferase [Bacillota bacterium]